MNNRERAEHKRGMLHAKQTLRRIKSKRSKAMRDYIKRTKKAWRKFSTMLRNPIKGTFVSRMIEDHQ